MNPVSIEFVIANWFENIIVRQEQFGGEDICSSFCLGVIQAIKISVLKCLARAGMLPVKQCVSQFMSQSRYVMGGWGIWEIVNGEQKLTTECIENVIMMVPFSAVVMWTFGKKIGNSWKKILWQSGKIAFIFSISIEMLQLLLRLGTFQLSDILYNTVGGVLGGLMYCAVMRARKQGLTVWTN